MQALLLHTSMTGQPWQEAPAVSASTGRGVSALCPRPRQQEEKVCLPCVPCIASAACFRRGKGRHGGTTEENEDAELLADETGDGEAAGHRLSVQPAIITGGKLREYQMQGLNWMIHLYDNGINGILADEMVPMVMR